jgi:hypothetical protein
MSVTDSIEVKRKSSKPSCAKRCWMCSRHSCCRYGWYPVFVAPILTLACLLSLYSAGGCDFITVNVGFTPQPNVGWNESQASLGMWYYAKEGVEEHELAEYVPEVYYNGECTWYEDGFDEVFIAKDRTWKVARIMTMVAGGASTLAALMSWMYVFSPFPTSFVWPALFLPVVMIAFIAEGSKFLIFDIGVCRTSVWLPSGVNSLPQTAESCELGESAYFSIGAGAFLLVGLLFVCLKVPHERELDPHYGMVEDSSHDSNEDTDDPLDDGDEEDQLYEEFDDVVDEYPSPITSAARQETLADTEDDENTMDKMSHGTSYRTENTDGGSLFNKHEDDIMMSPSVEAESKPSESRFTTLANIEASQQQETQQEDSLGSQLLERLVNDLNCTFQTAKPTTEEEDK